MFYQNKNKVEKLKAVVTLNPSESKRLIAKAVARISVVKKAYKKGRLIIIGSATNAFIVEELTGNRVNKFLLCRWRCFSRKAGVQPTVGSLKAFCF